MTLKTDYAPGVCNIGAAEIRRRKRAGWAGAVMFAVAFAALLIGGAAPVWHLLLVLPAFAAAIGFVQARSRFCVYFGFASLFNFSELGQEARIVDPEARRRDRAQAIRLLSISGLFAAVAALAAYGVANLVG